MIKNRKQSLIVIGTFILILLLGTTTYAFFNYTRTGSSNTIKTGRISFSTNQTNTINLTNVFPIDSEQALTDQDNTDEVIITITGDTTYSDGIEYLLKAVDVHNSVGNKQIPMNLLVSATSGLGEEDEEYYQDRESADSSIYKLLSKEALKDGDYLLVGYIKSGENAVNGTISIKAYIDEKQIAISDTYPQTETLKEYFFNPKISDELLSTCVDYIENEWEYGDSLDSGTTPESFCQGDGTSYSYTFQEWLDQQWFYYSELQRMQELNLIYMVESGYANGTSDEWVKGRTVFTTEEWNSLQTNGVSFKVKVEANEGIWVNEQFSVNSMKSSIYNTVLYNKQNVKEVYFIRDKQENIDVRYEAATDKMDLTDNKEGQVRGWIENDKLYIASDGNTYLNDGFQFRDISNNIEKIEFQNIDTSRMTTMQNLFRGIKISSIDLSDFDMSNVTNFQYMFSDNGYLLSVDMKEKNLQSVSRMNYMFRGCSNLESVDFSDTITPSIRSINYMFAGCSSLTSVDLSNWGNSNFDNPAAMFSGCTSLTSITMTNFNFGTAYLDGLFETCSSLTNLDLSGSNMERVSLPYLLFKNNTSIQYVNMANVSFGSYSLSELFASKNNLIEVDLSGANVSNLTSISYMFANSSNLETIYVSNSWNVSNIQNSSNMFDGCTSLVGGNGTVYDENNPTDNTYAHIDGGQDNPGYLTLKTN